MKAISAMEQGRKCKNIQFLTTRRKSDFPVNELDLQTLDLNIPGSLGTFNIGDTKVVLAYSQVAYSQVEGWITGGSTGIISSTGQQVTADDNNGSGPITIQA